MISRQDIQRLLHRPDGGPPILSVFLDMSVDSTNKRTYPVFLSRERSRYAELDSDRSPHHREALGAALERVETWLDTRFDEANKGVAIYTEVGGEWFDALQFPASVPNRLAVTRHPVIRPLVEMLGNHHHHGVLLVDRQHLRMLSVYLDAPVREHEVRTEPYPTPHDVQAGGFSQKDYQKRKAEEVRHFFKEFALEVAEFQRRYRPDDFILLGTTENVKQFLEFLPAPVRDAVAHTAHAPVDATTAEVLERLAPHFTEQLRREQDRTVDLLHDRVAQHHLAAAGFHDALEQLQEGKVQTLVLARDAERTGARCTRCAFLLAQAHAPCPYCSGPTRDGVDMVEAMVRLAEEQDVPVEFVQPQALSDLDGVGALLKF